jgi:hypothetical protein
LSNVTFNTFLCVIEDVIGILHGWINELFVAWFDRYKLLSNYALNGSPQFNHVAQNPTCQTSIKIRMNEYFSID